MTETPMTTAQTNHTPTAEQALPGRSATFVPR